MAPSAAHGHPWHCYVPRKENPIGGQTREGGWEQQSRQDSPSFPRFLPLSGVATPRVLRTLFAGIKTALESTAWARLSPGGASGKRPRWGPLNLEEPLQCGRPLGEFFVDIRPSIYHGLEHHAMFRSGKIGLVELPTARRNLRVTVNL